MTSYTDNHRLTIGTYSYPVFTKSDRRTTAQVINNETAGRTPYSTDTTTSNLHYNNPESIQATYILRHVHFHRDIF